jgi:hypothetical protein
MPPAVDTIVRVTFSFVHGLAVAMVLPIYFMMYPEFSKTYLYVILFAIVPAFSYVFSLALNSLTQYISCGTVVFGQIALASIFNPIFVLIFAFISWMFPVLRTFVSAILPEQPLDVMKQEGDTTMKITVRQLKTLIREAAAEAMDEMADADEGMHDMKEAGEDEKKEAMEEQLQEAVAAAFRAGYRRGRTAPATRTSRR